MAIENNTTALQDILSAVNALPDQIDTTDAETGLTEFLTGAGVTVPDGTGLDGLVALLAGVSAGGLVDFTYGSITPSDNHYIFTVEHGLGAIPGYFYMIKTSAAADQEDEVVMAVFVKYHTYVNLWTVREVYNLYGTTSFKQTTGVNLTLDTTTPFRNLTENSVGVYGRQIHAGTTYDWFALPYGGLTT